jgi:hypothetical protein
MVGGMFATAVQVLDPHIVLHVSISRVNTRPCIESALTCISAYEYITEMNERLSSSDNKQRL